MGHGASRSYSVSQERTPTVSIPIDDLLSRVKVFQDSAGEVVVVLDDDVKSVVHNLEGAVLCTYHPSQKKYYDSMLKACEINDDTTLTTAGIRSDTSLPMTEANYSRNFSEKPMKTIQVMAKNGKGNADTYADDDRDRARSEESKNGSAAGHAATYTSVPYSAPNSKGIHNDLTQDARIQSMLKGKRTKNSGVSGSGNSGDEFKSFDGDHFSSHRVGSGRHQKFPTRCNICNEWFPESAQLDLIQEHIEVCKESFEIKKAMEEINEKLQPSLMELSQSNHLMVREIIYNALSAACAEIDDCDSLNNKVQLLAKRVVNINHTSTSDGRVISQLRRDIVVQLNDILSLIDNEKTAENPDKEFLGDLVYFRNLLDDCLNQLKEKTSVLLKYKKTQLKATDFKFIRALGRGGFGAVYLAQRTTSLKLYAIKVMNKIAIKSVNFELQVLRERKALSKALEYPDLFIRLHGAFQTVEDLFLVMEYVPGGDCMTLLMSLRQFPEHVAQHIIAQVCVAVKHLHMHGVVHRDIKPDNVLITKQGHVKLADFGLVAPFTRQSTGASDSEDSSYSIGNSVGTRQRRSCAVTTSDATGKEEQWLDDDADIINPDTVSRVYNSSSSLILSKPNYKLEQVGNYNYSSPEMVIRSPYDHTVDWWSIGVMLFHFVAGVTPFDDVSREKVHENIVLFNVQWQKLPNHISGACRDFIAGIITKTVEYRLGYKSSDQVLGHEFFKGINFKTLYANMGPYYPQIEGKTGKEFHVFATLSEKEAYGMPDFTSQLTDDEMNDEFLHYNFFR